MRANAVAGIAIAGTGLCAAALLGYVLARYLTQYGGHTVLAAGAALGCSAAGLLLGRRVARARSARAAAWTLAALASAVLLVGCSLLTGRVTFARFGLTVFGAIPVPMLDITVDSRGLLWFRDKTHRVTLAELQALAPGQEHVVVGIGWQSQVRVDDDCESTFRDRLHVVPTPQAVWLYHYLKYEGLRVVLLLHSTC